MAACPSELNQTTRHIFYAYSSLPLTIPRTTKTPNKAAPLNAMLTTSRVIINPSFIVNFPPGRLCKITGPIIRIQLYVSMHRGSCENESRYKNSHTPKYGSQFLKISGLKRPNRAIKEQKLLPKSYSLQAILSTERCKSV